MLSPNGLLMAQNKIQAIQNWPEPPKVQDIMSFLGFANFYHRFIYGYSEITVPLTRLTQKDVPWVFSDNCWESFKKLKKAFITAPVLTHWIPDTPIMVETDASDYALAAVLSIRTPVGDYHPVAFHSRTFKDAETNYDIHDKELTAIYDAFKRWHHYLEGASTPIDVVTNHHNLKYFSTTKVLSRRQAQCSEYLSQFNMVIRFHPRKLGTKPDALTHHWDVYPKEGSSDYSNINPQNLQLVFTNEQLALSLCASTLWLPALWGLLIMDTEKLTADIVSSLQSDLTALAHLSNQTDPDGPPVPMDFSGFSKFK